MKKEVNESEVNEAAARDALRAALDGANPATTIVAVVLDDDDSEHGKLVGIKITERKLVTSALGIFGALGEVGRAAVMAGILELTEAAGRGAAAKANETLH